MLKQLMAGPPPLSLALAESMTGGRLQSLVTAESGASAYFLGGVTAYTLEQKVQLLGVARAVAEPADCVSAEVAWQMAQGACALFGADLAAATTGYAEPAPGRGQAEPCVYWAICHRLADGSTVRRESFVRFAGADRAAAQAAAAAAVLGELVRYLGEHRRAGR